MLPAAIVDPDWSQLANVVAEWPSSDLDPTADRAAWQQAMHLYDSRDDYASMMTIAPSLAQALAHSLHGPGILEGDELPETTHRTLYAALVRPPDGQTFEPPIQRCARVALMVCRENGWQPAQWGGAGLFDSIVLDAGNRILLGIAIGPADRPWTGDLAKFFSTPRTPISAGKTPAIENPIFAVLDEIEEVGSKADAGDEASIARQRGFSAHLNGQYREAFEHFEEAASLGDVSSMFDAGTTAEKLGMRSQGQYWLSQAAEHGHGQAAYNLGVWAATDGDTEAAIEWFAKAGSAGEADAYGALTQLADDAGDREAETRWSRLGADAGQHFCQMRYGQILLRSAGDNSDLLRRALPYLQRAGEGGEVGGLFLTGICYAQLGQDLDARSWLQRAADAGFQRAAAILRERGWSAD